MGFHRKEKRLPLMRRPFSVKIYWLLQVCGGLFHAHRVLFAPDGHRFERAGGEGRVGARHRRAASLRGERKALPRTCSGAVPEAEVRFLEKLDKIQV